MSGSEDAVETGNNPVDTEDGQEEPVQEAAPTADAVTAATEGEPIYDVGQAEDAEG